MPLSIIEILGYMGSACTLSAVCMKTMIPLRFFAICSNVLFIVYAYYLSLPSILILQCILLPINGFRLFQMRKLVQDVKEAAADDLSVEWLLPYMSGMRISKDDVLCRKGEPADALYYISEGNVHLPDLDTHLDAGNLVGEVGLFSPERVRTMTVICGENCRVMRISAEKVHELYHQNPSFGLYMIELITQRLIRNIKHLEQKNMRLTTQENS